MRKYLIFIGFISFYSAFLYAQTPLKTCLWKPYPNSTSFLIPAVSDVKQNNLSLCKKAVQKYVDAVNADADLRKMMGGYTLPIPVESSYQIFNPKSKLPRPQFIVNANEFNQVSDPAEFVMTNIHQKLTTAGADVIALPVAAAIALTSEQTTQFHQFIGAHFDAMMSLGGQDINPALYNQKITTAIPEDVHPTRDAYESKVQAAYIQQSKGVFYGICRGHQLASVTQGQKLYQDIYTADIYTPIGHTKTAHGQGAWHPITLDEKSILLKWAQTELINGKPVLWVNSFHHQAVAYPLNITAGSKQITVTGFEQDDETQESHKIIEVLESADGRYITMQFHPEGMDDDQHDNGTKIMKGLVAHALQMRP